jgi:hypothetical protein
MRNVIVLGGQDALLPTHWPERLGRLNQHPVPADRADLHHAAAGHWRTGGFTVFEYQSGEAQDTVPMCGKGITRKQ